MKNRWFLLMLSCTLLMQFSSSEAKDKRKVLLLLPGSAMHKYGMIYVQDAVEKSFAGKMEVLYHLDFANYFDPAAETGTPDKGAYYLDDFLGKAGVKDAELYFAANEIAGLVLRRYLSAAGNYEGKRFSPPRNVKAIINFGVPDGGFKGKKYVNTWVSEARMNPRTSGNNGAVMPFNERYKLPSGIKVFSLVGIYHNDSTSVSYSVNSAHLARDEGTPHDGVVGRWSAIYFREHKDLLRQGVTMEYFETPLGELSTGNAYLQNEGLMQHVDLLKMVIEKLAEYSGLDYQLRIGFFEFE